MILRHFIKIIFCYLVINISIITSVFAASIPNVVVSIKPLHGIVSALMADIATPTLLAKLDHSAHHMELSHAQHRLLQDADIIVIIDRQGLELSLHDALKNSKKSSMIIDLSKSNAYSALWRDGVHTHHNHDHESHHDHGNVYKNGAHSKVRDPHFWGSPLQVIEVVDFLAKKFAEYDPAHRSQYERNASNFTSRLKQLDSQFMRELEPYRQVPFVVFHDGFRYFVDRYQLRMLDALVIEPEIAPSAKRLAELQSLLKESDTKCLFVDMDHQNALIKPLADSVGGTVERVDIEIGRDIPLGRDFYPMLMERLVSQIGRCLQNYRRLVS
jgi:zinc transport system substrate-binding protein